MDDIKKQVFVGEDASTKAEVVEENRSTRSLDAKHCKALVEQAARIQCPIGAEYLGSAAIHYYSAQGADSTEKKYFVVCQTDVVKVEEGFADLGWKALKSAMQKCYGRTEPKMRH